jgi:oxygen-independent coproporphyrinogen-3 oxidase
MDKIFFELTENDKFNTSYPIKPEHWKKYKSTMPLVFDEREICFYAHIPFCESLCKFCEYIKYKNPDEKTQLKYVNILIADINKFINAHNDVTLFGFDIGGGTPTCLNDNVFEILMDNVIKIINKIQVSDDFEPSIEATFSTITENKIKMLTKNEPKPLFKRISFGIQTLNNKILDENNRMNLNSKNIEKVFTLCKNYHIEKINIDMMYGLSGQNLSDLRHSIEFTRIFMPSQVTLYEFRTNILNITENKTKEQLFIQYSYLFDELTNLGYYGSFGQNTFSLNKDDYGLSSYLRHRVFDNMAYRGFGISAQSKNKDGVAYNIGKNRESLQECLMGESIVYDDIYKLPKEELLAKYMAISGYSGKFSIKIMSTILKEDASEYFKEQIKFLINNDFICINNETSIVEITKVGFKYYGAILAMFYPPVIMGLL